MRQRLEIVVPVSMAFFAVVMFVLVLGGKIEVGSIKVIHAIAYLALGVFFEIPELCLNFLCLFAGRSNSFPLRRVVKIRYFLTHYVAPTAGIWIMASGFCLIELNHETLTSGWLFWVLFASTIGFYKGMTQHNSYVKGLKRLLNHNMDPQEYHRVLRSPFDQVLIYTELPTYFFNYWAACTKPQWLVNPLAGMIGLLEGLWHSPAGVGFFLSLCGAVLIWPLTFMMRKLSRVSQLMAYR